jgi:hypothetical protein
MKQSRLVPILMLVALNVVYVVNHFASKVYASVQPLDYGCKSPISSCSIGGAAGVCTDLYNGNHYCACVIGSGASSGTYSCQGSD